MHVEFLDWLFGLNAVGVVAWSANDIARPTSPLCMGLTAWHTIPRAARTSSLVDHCYVGLVRTIVNDNADNAEGKHVSQMYQSLVNDHLTCSHQRF